MTVSCSLDSSVNLAKLKKENEHKISSLPSLRNEILMPLVSQGSVVYRAKIKMLKAVGFCFYSLCVYRP